MRESMIEALASKRVIVTSEWAKENDWELYDWLHGHLVCFKAEGAATEEDIESFANGDYLIELCFSNGGVGYIAGRTKQDLNNQPYWGEDKIEEYPYELLELYYKRVFGSPIIDVLTVSEAVELDSVAKHYKNKKNAIRAIQKKLQRGSSFRHGVDCRKAGDTWLVTREAIEREYKEE